MDTQFVDWDQYLADLLKDPAIRNGFEKEQNKANLQLFINKLLQEAGSNYYVEVMDYDD